MISDYIIPYDLFTVITDIDIVKIMIIMRMTKITLKTNNPSFLSKAGCSLTKYKLAV